MERIAYLLKAPKDTEDAPFATQSDEGKDQEEVESEQPNTRSPMFQLLKCVK